MNDYIWLIHSISSLGSKKVFYVLFFLHFLHFTCPSFLLHFSSYLSYSKFVKILLWFGILFRSYEKKNHFHFSLLFYYPLIIRLILINWSVSDKSQIFYHSLVQHKHCAIVDLFPIELSSLSISKYIYLYQVIK